MRGAKKNIGTRDIKSVTPALPGTYLVGVSTTELVDIPNVKTGEECKLPAVMVLPIVAWETVINANYMMGGDGLGYNVSIPVTITLLPTSGFVYGIKFQTDDAIYQPGICEYANLEEFRLAVLRSIKSVQ